MKIWHSIIFAHRNRYKYAEASLRSIEIASQYSHLPVEVIMVDLGSDYPVTELKNRFPMLRVIPINYKGTFLLAKALNHGVLKARGKIISKLDIDCIVGTRFLYNVENFFLHNVYYQQQAMLNHRMAMVDKKTTTRFLNFANNFSEASVIKYLEQKRFRHFHERYGPDCLRLDQISDIADSGINKEKHFLGNSVFSMQKINFINIGGFDEIYKGYGCEDIDFKLRYFRKFQLGIPNLSPSSQCYHLYHSRTGSIDNHKWRIPDLEKYNKKIFLKLLKDKKRNPIIKQNYFGDFSSID